MVDLAIIEAELLEEGVHQFLAFVHVPRRLKGRDRHLYALCNVLDLLPHSFHPRLVFQVVVHLHPTYSDTDLQLPFLHQRLLRPLVDLRELAFILVAFGVHHEGICKYPAYGYPELPRFDWFDRQIQSPNLTLLQHALDRVDLYKTGVMLWWYYLEGSLDVSDVLDGQLSAQELIGVVHVPFVDLAKVDSVLRQLQGSLSHFAVHRNGNRLRMLNLNPYLQLD